MIEHSARKLASTAAVTVAAVALGACSGASPQRRAASGSTGVTSTAVAATPVPAEQYPAALKAAAAPLDKALKAVSKETSADRLTDRLTNAMDAGAAAIEDLRRIGPPAELAAEHARLVDALRRLELEIINTRTGADNHELCTGSAALTKLEKADTVAAVRQALAAVAAKAPAAKDVLEVPAARGGSARPANGRLVKPGNRTGSGELRIDNGGDSDALIKARKGGKVAFSVFVRKGKKHTVSGVTDGSYEIFFATGSGWDSAAKAFREDCRFQRFDGDLKFKTTRTFSQIRSSSWRITLQPVAGGNAKTSDVESFPED